MALQKLADRLFILPGRANMYLIDAPEGLTLIDTGFPGSADMVFDAMATLGKAPGDLKHVVATHAHADHIGSLGQIVRRSGARTYMHLLDAPIAASGSGFRPLSPAPGLLPWLLFKLFAGRVQSVEPAAIDVQVKDGDIIPLAGGLQVVHVPGHCAGQIALLWPARKTLFTGDACMNIFGLGPPIGYEDRAEGERSQRKLAALDFEIACFGHGKPITMGAAQQFRGAFG